METKLLSDLIVKDIIGSRYVELYLPFSYYSKILDKVVVIPEGFICDYESVLFIKSTSKVGRVVHDYWCRKNSDPIVTKQQAADLYLEVQKCRDNILNGGWFARFNRSCRRNVKTLVVRAVFGYFHKLKVKSTLEEVSGANK